MQKLATFISAVLAGAAISSTAASGVSNPGALAAVDPAYAAIAPIATAQVAASVLVSSFLTPVLTSLVVKRREGRSKAGGIGGKDPEVA